MLPRNLSENKVGYPDSVQMQVNNKLKPTYLRPQAPDTVSGPVLVPMDNPLSPDEIIAAFKASCSF